MKKLTGIIEKADDNYSAYIEGVDGVVATGKTLDETKANLIDAVEFFVEGCNDTGCEIPEELGEEFEIEFKIDVKSPHVF